MIWFFLSSAIVIIVMLVVSKIFIVWLENKKIEACNTLNSLLKERRDYVDDLIDLVEEYSEELDIVDVTIQTRNMILQSSNLMQKKHNEEILGYCLEKFFQQAENCASLTNDKQYKEIMTKIKMLEKKIATSRNQYSRVANAYNKAISTFPLSIVASMFK